MEEKTKYKGILMLPALENLLSFILVQAFAIAAKFSLIASVISPQKTRTGVLVQKPTSRGACATRF